MAMADFFDNPQKSLTVVVVMAALGLLGITFLGFFYAAKSPELVGGAQKTFDAILIGAVGGKLALAIPGAGRNNNGDSGTSKPQS